MTDSPWPTIHAERKALAADLTGMPDDAWNKPSLCAGWTVHQVLAHQVGTANMTPGKFFAKFAAAGFSFSRFAVGMSHAYPLDWVTKAAEFYAGSNAIIGGKKRVVGVTLKATDTTWSHGSGPLVEGPAMSLLMATAGRKAALDDLSGPGLDSLRSR